MNSAPKTLYELLVKSSESIIKTQNTDGSFQPGHNGVRLDPETPVRNTSHWLITLLKAYRITNDSFFKDAAYKAIKYLLSKDARPMNASFFHRTNPNKDFCNGVMGQAYTIEALSIAYEIFELKEIKRICEKVFLMHRQEESNGLWGRVEVDGSALSIDGTFNHQLWFAASGALLYKYCQNHEVKAKVDCFMYNLPQIFNIYNNNYDGLIIHAIKNERKRKRDFKGLFHKYYKYFLETNSDVNLKIIKHAMGYHMFNLYAFAIIKETHNNVGFWEDKKFIKALSYINDSNFRNTVESSSFSNPHSPAGFEGYYIERAYVLDVFYLSIDNHSEKKSLLKEQFKKTLNTVDYLMSKNSIDPLTQAARLYKATRLNDIEID